MKTKTCSRCNKTKQKSQFFKDSYGRFRQRCIECNNKEKKLRLQDKKECRCCGEIKCLSEFNTRKSGKKKNRCPKTFCAECDSEHSTELKFRYASLARKGIFTISYRKTLLRAAKLRAEKHGLEFNIDLSDIIIPKFCPVFNIELKANKCNDFGVSSPTLDRIDVTKGYVKGNVMVISYKANMVKNCGTIDEHKKIIKYMTKHGCK